MITFGGQYLVIGSMVLIGQLLEAGFSIEVRGVIKLFGLYQMYEQGEQGLEGEEKRRDG